MPPDRHQARITAMQALCQWDVQRDESPEALRDFLAARDVPPDVAGYAGDVVGAYRAQSRRIDETIAAAATKWDFSRISPVERNIMRVAAVEILGDEVPPKVALNEAIEIGREFGGEDSPRFINGVLDVVLKKLQSGREGDA